MNRDQAQHLWNSIVSFSSHEFTFNEWHQSKEAQTLIASLAGEDWISVEDRLPERNEPLMGYNDDGEREVLIPNFEATCLGYNPEIGVFKARLTAPGWAEIGQSYVNGTIKPTHWKPLPKPPKSIKP